MKLPTYATAPAELHRWGWDRPLLEWSVDALVADGQRLNNSLLDLSRLLVIVPTSTTRRRLLAELGTRFSAHGVLNPQIWTPGELLEKALPLDVDAAASMEMRLAWTSVLQDVDFATLAHLFPLPPKEQSFQWAFQLSGVLATLAKDVADVGLNFAMIFGKMGENHPEAPRWGELAALETAYYAELARVRLVDAHAARRELLKVARQPENVQKVWAIGLVDPPSTALDVLQKWAMDGLDVHIGIWADESVPGTAFDAWGLPTQDFWTAEPIPFTSLADQLAVRQDAAAQAEEMVQWLWNKPDRGAVGLTDSELQSPLLFELEKRGLSGFVPEGVPMRRQLLSWMLTLLADLVEKRSWQSFSLLLRVPCVLDWLEGEVKTRLDLERAFLLSVFDAFQAEHLPVTLPFALQLAQGTINREPEGKRTRDDARKVEVAISVMLELLKSFENQPLQEALPAALQVWCKNLKLVVGSRESRVFAQAEEALLAAMQRVVRAVGFYRGQIPPAQQIQLILRDLEAVSLFPDRQQDDEFALQGWLELLWEPAGYLAIGGLNEGQVPESIQGDAWLPHGQREVLGMRTNGDRFARDAYMLQSLLRHRSRPGRGLLLTVGRESTDGGPLKPSRLLVQCALDELPGRVDYLFNQAENQPPPKLLNPTKQWKIKLPAPSVEKLRLTKFSVTSFRDYLACPLRYYMKHLLGMKAYDADPDEPDARAFGNLCHDALMAMAKDDRINRSTEASRIEEYLREDVYRRVRETFGEELSLQLFIYRETACNRLASAAEIHANSRRQGWFVWKVEESLSDILEKPWELEQVSINGRVDLIEVNESQKAWRIVDYKTADTAKRPEEAHLASTANKPEWQHTQNSQSKPAAWSDLQLPLYVAALSGHPFLRNFRPGAAYINLPSAVSDTHLVEWPELAQPSVQDSAVACASEVLRRIKRGLFWPPTRRPRYDDFEEMFLGDVEATVDSSLLEAFIAQPPPELADAAQFQLSAD